MLNKKPIPPLDEQARALAAGRQKQLTKPSGALGRLETLSLALAAMQGKAVPQCEHVAVLIFAGDHGVAVQGVSAFPSSVTAQMCLNFCHGGAAVNVLAKQAGATLSVIDVGVAEVLPLHADLVQAKVALGTADFTAGPAMSTKQCGQAMAVGATQVDRVITAGAEMIVFGEMGIANTTSASALLAAYTGLPVADCCGRGTGISDDGLARKQHVVTVGLERHAQTTGDAYAILAAFGGLEIAAMAGGMLAAASARVPVMVDGFISSAAALAAINIDPAITSYLLWSHRSAEGPHALLIEHVGAKPLLDLDLRLGEGSGGVLAIHLVRAACRTLQQMATFAEAGVANKQAAEATEQAEKAAIKAATTA